MSGMMRFCFLVLMIAVAGPARAQGLSGNGILLDSYAAIVNGKVIPVGQVLAALQPVQERLETRHEGEELRQKLQQEYQAIRDALIESELILADFQMQGGTLPDRAVEDHINSVIRDQFGNDRTALLKALAAERLTFAGWRRQMKEQFIVQVMRQREVSAKLLVTPLDLQAAYERRRAEFSVPECVRLRILSLPAGDTATRAHLIARLRSGEVAFADAAENGTLQDDGEFLDVANISPIFREAIAALAPGGISDPVATDDAVFLVQLIERQPARIQPFEEVAPGIERDLRREEYERLIRIWIDSLRHKYYVQVFDHDLFADVPAAARPPSARLPSAAEMDAAPPRAEPSPAMSPPGPAPQSNAAASGADSSETGQPVFW